jgi:hypothetical protein
MTNMLFMPKGSTVIEVCAQSILFNQGLSWPFQPISQCAPIYFFLFDLKMLQNSNKVVITFLFDHASIFKDAVSISFERYHFLKITWYKLLVLIFAKFSLWLCFHWIFRVLMIFLSTFRVLSHNCVSFHSSLTWTVAMASWQQPWTLTTGWYPLCRQVCYIHNNVASPALMNTYAPFYFTIASGFLKRARSLNRIHRGLQCYNWIMWLLINSNLELAISIRDFIDFLGNSRRF